MASSLSAGKLIRKLLQESEGVKALKPTKIFPVVADNAVLPYIAYRRSAMVARGLKGESLVNADTVEIEVVVFTADYESGVKLAEAVRTTLDGAHGTADGLRMRSCWMSGGSEAWQDDAYLQQMIFTIKISEV